jgi:hypothetical protein
VIVAKVRSQALVIDASVAQAAGLQGATHPTAKHCRDFLLVALEVCHRMVFTQAIEEEWDEHQSRFARMWRRSMFARKKIDRVEASADTTFREQLEQAATGEKQKDAMLKDAHLIEAARTGGLRIVALDDTVRGLFRGVALSVPALRAVCWINPAKACHPSEHPESWSSRTGAVNRSGARLGEFHELDWKNRLDISFVDNSYMNTLPKRSVVYPGCLLAAIVDAVGTISYGFHSYHQLEENAYLYDGTDGNYACVVFAGESLVATVCDVHSDRAPGRCEGLFDVGRFFRGMPDSHRPLAERALGSLRTEKDGELVPLISAAFWDDGEYLAAAEPWDVVWENGGDILERQLMEDQEAALAEWAAGNSLSPEQVQLARSLFQQKMARPDVTIQLTAEDMRVLLAPAENAITRLLQTFSGSKGIEAGRQAFASLGIHLLEEFNDDPQDPDQAS